MATNYLAVTQTVSGYARFLPGVKWYYPVPDSNNRTEAINAFEVDEVREMKLLPKLPTADVGKIWSIRTKIIDNGASWWIARNQTTGGGLGQISTYLDAEPGLYLQSVLTDEYGRMYLAQYTEDQAGYARKDLIDPDRAGGLPRYAALHQSIPNGTFSAQAKKSNGTVLKSATGIPFTETGPFSALSNTAPTNPTGPIKPTLPDEGSSETYSGIMISDAGIATDSDKIVTLAEFKNGKGRPKYSGTYAARDGWRLMFFVGDERGFLSQSDFESAWFFAGVPTLITIVEVANGNNNQESFYNNSPFKSEQVFNIH